jgi:hypothetical protein
MYYEILDLIGKASLTEHKYISLDTMICEKKEDAEHLLKRIDGNPFL